ncbi:MULTISPECIES: hypothetical protein [Clostridia]|jgi:hypothetical protein|uniref:hypothetical protein n=1 Tax=Clostridia TaxID=186801 RepID=UPI001C11652B|nr:hypothetical protein [Roseburia sp. MSJ-14]MBQ6412456.1 hypothetical protein [Ruminococcus sp.]MBU5474328.1 hypothetical protein [Roseburia sp. MSJ-14]
MSKAMCSSGDCKEKKGGSLKCILGGMLAGAAVSAGAICLMSNNKKMLQKKANKVAQAMEDLLDSAKDMFQ